MHFRYRQTGEYVELQALPFPTDRKVAGNATLVSTTANIKLGRGYDLESVHPDLKALAALIAFYPWIGGTLVMDDSISAEFSRVVSEVCRIDAGPTSDSIHPRTPTQNAVPGLSFSGGVDSMAAHAVLPENTESVFTLRTPPANGARSLYKPDVALHAIHEMGRAGKQVHIVESDHEWVRSPVGFATDPAPSVPLILMADSLDLDAVTFGTIAESAYLTGKGTWQDYSKRTVYTRWSKLFRAAGMEFNNVVAGISEFGTSTIVQSSPFGHLAESCIRGIPGKPCKACVKCFRKSLISASISNSWPTTALVSSMMAKPTIKGYLEKSPIRFEIMLISALNEYDGHDPLLTQLRHRVHADSLDASFTKAWYPDAMKLISEKYRHSTTKAISQYLPKMNQAQTEAFEAFDILPMMNSNNHEQAVNKFRNLLAWNCTPETQRYLTQTL